MAPLGSDVSGAAPDGAGRPAHGEGANMPAADATQGASRRRETTRNERFRVLAGVLERQIDRLPELHGDRAGVKAELRRLVAYARGRAGAPPPEPEPARRRPSPSRSPRRRFRTGKVREPRRPAKVSPSPHCRMALCRPRRPRRRSPRPQPSPGPPGALEPDNEEP